MDVDLVNVVNEYDTAAEDFSKVLEEFQSAINKMISFNAFADKESDTNQIHCISPDDNTTYDNSVVSSESTLECTQEIIVEEETPVEKQQHPISVTANKIATESTFKKCAQERTVEEVDKDETLVAKQQHQVAPTTNKSDIESACKICTQEGTVEEVKKEEPLSAKQEQQIPPTTNKRAAESDARVMRKRRMTTPTTVASPSKAVQKANAKKMAKVNPIDKLTGLPIPLFKELSNFNNSNQGDHGFYRRLLYEA